MRQVRCYIHQGRSAAYTLTRAVLIYRGEGASIATVHPVAEGEHGPVLLAGKPLTAAAGLRLARELAKNALPRGFLPATLLYLDGAALAWWVPPARRHVAFRAPELGANERSAVVPHPGLVFCVAPRETWRVWAVQGSERPCADTPLFQAPYLNVDTRGHICSGNVRLPAGSTADCIEAWNQCFFNSFFTHTNAAGELVNYEGGAYGFWRDMLDQRFEGFPWEVLRPAGLTLAQAMAEATR